MKPEANAGKVQPETDLRSTPGIFPPWAEDTNCAITVCDAECRIIYMNKLSRETFLTPERPDLIGTDLRLCHSPASCRIIDRLLQSGGVNCYTIEKRGVRKMIYQTAWRIDGKVAGLAEISMVIPSELPHYIR